MKQSGEDNTPGNSDQNQWGDFRNEQPRSKLRGIEHPSLNSFRGKPRGIEPGGIKLSADFSGIFLCAFATLNHVDIFPMS